MLLRVGEEDIVPVTGHLTGRRMSLSDSGYQEVGCTIGRTYCMVVGAQPQLTICRNHGREVFVA